MKLVVAIVRPFKVPEITDAMSHEPGFPGVTVVSCRGFGRERARPHTHNAHEDLSDFTDYEMLLVAAPSESASNVVDRLAQLAHTGHPGDGKVFVLDLTAALGISTGVSGEGALR